MKELFIEKVFNPEATAMIEKINAILENYEAQGFELTLRQLYYQLVAGNLIPATRTWVQAGGKWVRDPSGSINAEPNYKWIGDIVSDARMAGLIDWRMIEDRGRVTRTNPHWDNPGQIVEAAAEGYRIDKWENQPVHVEVMVEKQALEGILIPVCQELDINFTANKGYTSMSALYNTSKRLMRMHRAGKNVHLIYLGDHDPSGIDMTRDITDRLALFSGQIPMEVSRIALNIGQVKKLKPPENPTKLTDSRAAGYIERFGTSCWELDAIEPKALAKLVRDEVYGVRDADLWEEAEAEEKKGRDQLRAFADKWKGKTK
jgi:hypothetical protein